MKGPRLTVAGCVPSTSQRHPHQMFSEFYMATGWPAAVRYFAAHSAGVGLPDLINHGHCFAQVSRGKNFLHSVGVSGRVTRLFAASTRSPASR